MSDEEDTIVVPAKKKTIILSPVGNWMEKVELNLSQPARLGRANAAPNHPNFVPFSSKVVSRSHAELWEHDGKFYVKDAGSASGTFLNSMKLNNNQTMELRHGDHLQLGVNYTDDENQLKQDSTLRCVHVEVLLPTGVGGAGGAGGSAGGSAGKTNAPQHIPQHIPQPQIPPPIPSHMSSYNAHAPHSPQIPQMPQIPHIPHIPQGYPSSSSPITNGVDLNNLTNVIKASKSRAQTATGDSSPLFNSLPEDYMGRKASNPELQNALMKKKEVEDKLNSAIQKSGNVANSVFEIKKEKNNFVVAIVRLAFKLTKIQVQSSGKDVFTVNLMPWEISNKLMIQDHRCQFTKTPSFEIIKDVTFRQNERFNVVHLNGNLIATIDKFDSQNVRITPVSGGLYITQGDIYGNYAMLFNGNRIAEIEDVETSKNQKGNLSRILNVFVDTDHNHQLVLAAVVILNATYP